MDTWGLRGTLAAAAVAAVIAGAGGAAIYAATGDSGGDFPFGGGHGGPGGPGPGHPPPAAMHDGGGGQDADDAVHAESTVSNGHGGYIVELTQTGTITAIDPGSVTARSTDGFVQHYVIPATVSNPPFQVGDEVAIRATRVGAVPTVTSLR